MAAGKKTGGRKKGSQNKVTKAMRAEIAESGLMPLDYMLSILRDPKAPPDKRAWAADKAAPYCHARLTSIAGDPDKPQIHRVQIGWESSRSGE